MKDKIGVFLGIVIAAMVLGTLSIYVLNAGNIDSNEIALMGIVLIVVVLAIFVLWDRIKNLRKGFPVKDERLILTEYKAGFYAFIAAILSASFGPLFFEILFDYELPGSRVTAVVVLVSGFVFGASYLYLNRKGDLK
jgi:ABC-type Fe3+ transport system permease subunit